MKLEVSPGLDGMGVSSAPLLGVPTQMSYRIGMFGGPSCFRGGKDQG